MPALFDGWDIIGAWLGHLSTADDSQKNIESEILCGNLLRFTQILSKITQN